VKVGNRRRRMNRSCGEAEGPEEEGGPREMREVTGDGWRCVGWVLVV
jgi:hypothetical protein